ncbi:MAG TPA: carbamoyltransferase C-terminal domain-containing protein, partial [Propionibacteriaceae bacterium]|nr:carbamoyltransferase C-terminal domain-containing protein [Propionibacteriaceae bacterium]
GVAAPLPVRHRHPNWTPVMRELRLWAAAAAGPVVAAGWFYSRLARPIRPRIRFSQGAGLSEPLPDALGVAVKLLVQPVRPDRRAQIPTVTHADGTARLQSVTAAENRLYHGLISRFAAHTGMPVVLNASFNLQATGGCGVPHWLVASELAELARGLGGPPPADDGFCSCLKG